MRNKTLFSLLVLCGSTAAIANLPSSQESPLQNDLTNEGVPASGDTTSNDTWSNATDVEPGSSAPTDSGSQTQTPPATTDVTPSGDTTDTGTQTPPDPSY